MAYATLRYEVADDGVATITLNDPETRNALSVELLDELIEALEAAATTPACAAWCWPPRTSGCSPRAPTSAASRPTMALVHKHFGTERFPRLFRLIGELGKPSICAANGHVLAGALGIALACDLIVATEGAQVRHARDQRRGSSRS